MDKLNPVARHYSYESIPTVYDEDALTALELAARTAGKVNECVKAFNNHLDECDELYQRFTKDVDGELADQDQDIKAATDYMKTHLEETAGALFDHAVEEGVFDTIPRDTYQNLTSGVFNVLEYGAVADGETDCSTAIQNAINAAKDHGATVYLPAGEYVITKSIAIHSHTKLIGAGKRGASENGYSGTHIIYQGDSSKPIIANNTAAACYGAEVRDIRVTGDALAGLQLYQASECYVHNFTVNGGCQYGVYAVDTTITHMDNLYLCGNNGGIMASGIHGVTISNLNAWDNGVGVTLTGNCYNVTLRDSWVEKSGIAINLSSIAGTSLIYGLAVQNVSFTAGSENARAQFIRAEQTQSGALCVQGLIVRGCVVKIHTPDDVEPIYFNTPTYNTIASIEDCVFFTNTSYTTAIDSANKYNRIMVSNVICQDYSGSDFPVINCDCAYLNVSPKQTYVEVMQGRPFKLNNLTGTIQNFNEGQFYYKDGRLRLTDGTQANMIPVQAEAVSGVSVNDITLPDLAQKVNDLLVALRASGVIKA